MARDRSNVDSASQKDKQLLTATLKTQTVIEPWDVGTKLCAAFERRVVWHGQRQTERATSSCEMHVDPGLQQGCKRPGPDLGTGPRDGRRRRRLLRERGPAGGVGIS